jgi:hypothetical protein
MELLITMTENYVKFEFIHMPFWKEHYTGNFGAWVWIITNKIGKTPQMPSVSVFCNLRTVDLTCTFQEQLIVGKNRFLAAQNKNSVSQAAQIFLSC